MNGLKPRNRECDGLKVCDIWRVWVRWAKGLWVYGSVWECACRLFSSSSTTHGRPGLFCPFGNKKGISNR